MLSKGSSSEHPAAHTLRGAVPALLTGTPVDRARGAEPSGPTTKLPSSVEYPISVADDAATTGRWADDAATTGRWADAAQPTTTTRPAVTAHTTHRRRHTA